MPKSILVIDDDSLVTKSLARLLEKEGYTVFTAGNYEEAANRVESTNFDLIISDVRMPGVDGIETVQKIKIALQQKEKKQIPIIFITGYADAASYESAKRLNSFDFIYKPFEREPFIESIHKALEVV